MADRFDLINLAKSMTTTLGGTTANVNIDANTLFVDGVNNRVGVGTNTPTAALHVTGTVQSQLGSSFAQMYADGGAAYFTSVGAFPSLFLTNGVERMRVAANGNIGIGTTTPSSPLHVRGVAGGTGESVFRITANSTFNGMAIQSSLANSTTFSAGFIDIMNESGSAVANILGEIATDGSSAWAFTTQPAGTRTDRRAERMRIFGNGVVTLGIHAGTGSTILSSNGTIVCTTFQEGGRTYETHNFNTYPNLYSSIFINTGVSSNIPPSSGGNSYRFVMGAGDTGGRGFDLVGTSAGQLYYRARENGTWYLVSASIPSDYRIKQNVTPLTTSIDTLKQVKPVSYRYKNIASPGANNSLQWADDGQNHLGFIAHELKEAIPSAVNGEKDAVTDVGGIQPQTLNVMPIVALLTSALQEAVGKIETLEARIEALENK